MPQNGGTYTFTVKPEADLSTISAQVKTLSAEFQKLKLPKNMGENLAKDTEKITSLIKKYQDQLVKGVNNKTDVKVLSETEKEINRVFGHLMDEIKEVNNHPIMLKVDAQKLEKLRTELKAAQDELKKGFEIHLGGDVNSFNALLNGIGRAKSLQGFAKEAQDAFNAGDIEAYGAAIDKIVNKINGFQPQTLKSIIKSLFPDKDIKNISETKDLLDLIIPSLDNIKKKGTEAIGATEDLRKVARETQDAFNKYETKALDRGKTAAEGTTKALEGQKQALQDVTHEENEAAKATANMKGQMDQLKSSTEYFFSLRNMFSLLRRGIHQAVETVKELDAAMTETAVVTDFSVSDMWGMLPQYTAQANKLGATIKDVYDATTLYYQQGLDTNQAMGLANETLKMARIAGLEAAAATDAMTAALRGFNMEINETSAQRINDVYSEIAAKTASDTEELSTAMSKTASLAHSAGMTFEGTTAFLAQMIETTREAPENLGTAMKTIIARFQEMKKNPLEIVEVEGEEVSYNKIDEALQSIGVSLKDANGQFRDLDDVFLEISAKWDSLTQTQQRYIATTAAGSRQQSRFIAMMSNYERVTQLVEYANNSAGASQEQFEKTLDSFEAKVNKLKNAWQEYLMGIADNTIIKKGIDLLTSGLDKVNKLMDSISHNNTTAKSILSIATAFMGLKAGGKFINAAIGGLGGMIDPKSSFFKGVFGGGATGQKEVQNDTFAAKIYTPITEVLREISGKMDVTRTSADNINEKNNPYIAQTYKERRQGFIKTNGMSLEDAGLRFEGLDRKQQQNLLNGLVGTKSAMKRASANWFNNLNLGKEAQKQGDVIRKSIWKGMEKGEISVDEGIKLLGRPEEWGAKFGTDTAKAVSQAYQQKVTEINKNADQIVKETAEKLKEDGLNLTEQDQQNMRNSYIQGQLGSGRKTVEKTKAEITADKFNNFGSTITQAGYAISSFGATISKINPALEGFGTAIQTIGGFVSSIGGMFTGATMAASGLASVLSIEFLPALGILGAAIAAVAVVAGIFVNHQKKLEEIRTTAEQVTESYNEINKATTDNINTLRSYKDELASLKDGVDENGYNVSLSTDNYDRYLEIVDKIAEINPDIVKFYNEQGHAVLDLNNALEDTLDLEEKRQKEALHTYTSQTSLQQLLDSRAINDTWKEYTSPNAFYSSGKGEVENKKSIQYKAKTTATTLQNAGFNLDRLTKYGINSDALLKGETKAIMQFTKNQSKILHEAESSLTTSWDTVGDGITEAFTDLGDAVKELNEINQPIFEQLATWIGQDTRFQNLDIEQKGFVTTGLQSIVMEDMDAPTMRKEARKVIREIDKQFGKGSPYENIMSRVEDAQKAFALDLDEQKYNEEIDGLISELETLRDESENIGGAAGEALYNAYERQLALLQDQAGQSAHDIMEALNPLSDEIASAEGAFSRFQEQTSSDFSTASKNMKQFFDVLNSDEHKAGYGDKSYWLAAKEVFSDKALEGKIKPSDLIKIQEQIEPLFADGTEGFNNFVDYLNGYKDKLPKNIKDMLFNKKGNLQFDFDDENIHEIAEALKLSDNTFTALLNKARQFAKIRFGNTEELRESLSLSNTTVFGKSTTDGGEGNIYVNREQIIADAYSSGAVNNPTEEADFIKQLEQANIQTIPGPGSLDSKHFDEWKGDFEGTFKEWKDNFKEDIGIISKGSEGIKESIAVFDKMGYGKEDIYQYTKTLLGKKNVSAEEFNNVYDAYVEEQNLDPVTEGMSTIEATLETIVNILAGGEVAAGNLNPEHLQSEALQEGTFGKDNVWDTMADMFAHGFNEFGQKLSEQEYDTNLETLTNYKQTAEDYLSDLREGLKTVEPNDKDKLLLYDKEINNILDYIKQLDKVIDSGEKVKEQQKDKEQQKQLKQYKEIGEQREAHKQGVNRTSEHSVENIEKTITWKNQYDGSDVEKKANKTKEHIEDKPAVIEGQVKFEGVDKAASTATNGKDATLQVGADTTPAAQAVSAEKAKFESDQTLMPVSADVDRHEVDNVIATIGKVRYIDIYPDFKGEWTKTIRVKAEKEAARGLNNHISSAGFYAGSMAKGSKGGTLGPKGKGGMTLTGEKGFEIAWLPSEQRSMILGARGPQLVDLPSDAVVWNHEQSKKIVKQKGIPAGSLSDVESEEISKWEEESSGNNKKTTKKVTKKKTKEKNKDSKNSHTNWLKIEVERFNLNQKINKITEKIEQRAQKIDKTLDQIGTTYSGISKDIDKEIKLLNQSNKLQTQLKDGYKEQLINLAKGGYKRDKDTNQRHLYMNLTNTKGESKEKSIGTGQFISGNAETGYSIDEKEIEKYVVSLGKYGKVGSNLLKQNVEIIFNALQSELSNAQSGYDNASKAIEDNKNKITDLKQRLAETFYLWENELTKTYKLANRVADAEANRGRYEAQMARYMAELESGYIDTESAIKSLNKFRDLNNKELKRSIKGQYELLESQRKDLANALDFNAQMKAVYKTLHSSKANDAQKEAAQQQYDKAKLASRYISSEQLKDGSFRINLDTKQIEKDRKAGNLSEQDYQIVKDIYDATIDLREDSKNTETELIEAQTAVYEELAQYQQDMASLEGDLIKALEDAAMKEVNKLESLNTSLTNATKRIIEQVKKTIDARRRAEDNAKTEADISKKEQRLAALRANTAGGNQVEIAQLEKEIADSRQSYGRTLEDQLLNDVQSQADEAARQRQLQIDLAKQQVQYNKDTGKYAQEADELLKDVKGNADAIKQLLEDPENKTQGKYQQAINDSELNKKIADGIIAQDGIKADEALLASEWFSKIQSNVEEMTANSRSPSEPTAKEKREAANTANKKIASANKVNTKAKNTLSTAEQNVGEARNALHIAQSSGDTTAISQAQRNLSQAEDKLAQATANSNVTSANLSEIKELYGNDTHAKGKLKSLPAAKLTKKSDIKKLQEGLNDLIDDGQITGVSKIKNPQGKGGAKTQAAVKALQKKLGRKETGEWNKKTAEDLRKHKRLKYYATGGLADSTGPAWLDGTPSRPELVLNAQDTKNFLALKDILSDAMRSISHTNNTETYNAPTEVNININVDKIANDYDVDKLAARLKKDIVKDMSYRNVTSVRNFR